MLDGSPDKLQRQELLPNVFLLFQASTGEQFAKIFSLTWERIPKSSKVTILNYWKSSEKPVILTLEKNVLAIHHDVLAQTSNGGFNLTFYERVFTMSDCLVGAVIAHELAHVFQHATGYDMNSRTPDLEANAMTLTRIWGFDESLIDEWHYIKKHFLYKR